MKKPFLLVLTLIFIYSLSAAQQSVPIFADRRDSVEYAKLIETTMKAMQSRSGGPADPSARRLDSLVRAQAAFRDRIIGFRVIYKADKDFTNYQDLKSMKIKPEEVIKLSYSDRPDKSLPDEIYACVNLAELELVNTRVRKLPSRLSKLTKLRSIYVYNNKTSARLRLGRNSTVGSLVIRGVNEAGLPRSYKNLKSLDSLDLSRNIGMVRFPNVYKNRNLKKLNLLENNITLLDLKETSGLSLEDLNLMKNKIKVVPDAIGSFSNLKKLTLNFNEIQDVRAGVGNLSKLESISFYQNKLTNLPPAVCQLTSLRSIDLYHNQIKAIGADMARLRNLRVLYLAHNQLEAMPDNLGALSMVREMYLHNNRLSTLPESVREMKELRVLRINNNYFTSLPASVLALTNLENLDFSRNYVYHFPLELSEFSRLQILAVMNNPWENEDDLTRVSEALQAKGTVVHVK